MLALSELFLVVVVLGFSEVLFVVLEVLFSVLADGFFLVTALSVVLVSFLTDGLRRVVLVVAFFAGAALDG